MNIVYQRKIKNRRKKKNHANQQTFERVLKRQETLYR